MEVGKVTRRLLRGVVVRNKMAKTITVQVSRTIRHPKYNKFLKTSERYHAHDENKTAQVGDTVLIMESRPLSKTKRWRLKEIVEKGTVV